MENKITWSLPVSSWKISHTCITCETRRQSFHSISLSETSIISVLFSANVLVCTEATDKASGHWEVGVMLPNSVSGKHLVENIMHKCFTVFWEAGSNMDLKHHTSPTRMNFNHSKSSILAMLWICLGPAGIWLPIIKETAATFATCWSALRIVSTGPISNQSKEKNPLNIASGVLWHIALYFSLLLRFEKEFITVATSRCNDTRVFSRQPTTEVESSVPSNM